MKHHYPIKEIILIIFFFIFVFIGIDYVYPEDRVSFTLGGESYSKEIPDNLEERKQMIYDLAKLISMYDETYGSTEQLVLSKLSDFSIEIGTTIDLIDDFINKVNKWEPEEFDYDEIRDQINALANISIVPYKFGIGGTGIINNLDIQNQYGAGINLHFQYKQLYITGLFGLLGNQTTLNSMVTIGFGVFLN